MSKFPEFIPLAKPHVTDDEVKAVTDVVRSGWWTTGPKVFEFENEVSSYIGNKRFTSAFCSCTGGLFLTLLALGIGKGDEVIVPTWTFAATAHVVKWCGADPILCDIDERTLNISIDSARKAISSKTRAIIPVHIAGYSCQMDELQDLSRQHRLHIIEDAAHAIGTKYKGRKIGSFGEVAVFSFYATKNLSCGEGGMVITGNQELSEKVRKLGYFGINKGAHNRYQKTGTWYYEIEELGYKYNMDSFQAALGLSQLKKLDEMNFRRGEIAKQYRANLKHVSFLHEEPENFHNYHLFIVLLPETHQRNELVEKLKEKNIGTSVHYIPLHLHPFYKSQDSTGAFPVANKMFEKVLSIPMFPQLTDDQVFYICEEMNRILGS